MPPNSERYDGSDWVGMPDPTFRASERPDRERLLRETGIRIQICQAGEARSRQSLCRAMEAISKSHCRIESTDQLIQKMWGRLCDPLGSP